ncbi:MAG: branched-chain amino acid aminotransferase [Crocinitomicaceae bacterium]|nr:branched-chain amino acid aminotransferase [Crocinitomicaceae bacterium]
MSADRKVYINGEFVSERDAKISIYDSALMFGDMVFEMTRSFNKKQFKLREHLERLYMGIKILHIPINMTIDELEKACLETIDINDAVFEAHDEHRLMINVSRGPLGIYAPVFDGKLEPTVVIADFPLKWTVSAIAPLFDSGINAVIPSQRAIPANLMEPKIKNRSRLFYQMANIEVSQMKGENNWALLLDPDGYITEGTGDNFFIVKNGEIITPEGRNILRGISREYIFEIAGQLGIPCRESNIEPYDVYEADEAFMTATPFCILPTVSLQGIKIGSGKMGIITTLLLQQWSKNVGVDIKGQIQEYGKEVAYLNTEATTPYQFKRQ